MNMHQIEITSRCNRACAYCIHRSMPRPKQDMSEETFRAVIGWAKRLNKPGDEVNLAGVGESLLHPQFVQFITFARQELSEARFVLATNGEAMTTEIADAMWRNAVFAWVTLHDMQAATPAVRMLVERRILGGISIHPALESINWAGQVEWPVMACRTVCEWRLREWLFVASDGSVLQCCQDGIGGSKLGTIDDDLAVMTPRRHSLCDKCNWVW